MTWLSFLHILNQERWFLVVLFILAFAGLVHWLLLAVFHRYSNEQRAPHYSLLTIWLHALERPLQVLIWILALSNILRISSTHLLLLQQNKLGIDWSQLEQVTVLGFVLWIGLRFLNQLERRVLKKQVYRKWQVDRTSLHAIMQLLRTLLIIACLLMLLQIWKIPMSSLLAVGGFGTLAVGFAAKDTLANFFGGFMIYIDRPFSVGEWISSPDQDIEGTVEHIGWRLTRIRTLDKKLLYVPNGLFSTISLLNPARMTHRRVKQIMSVRYEDTSRLPEIMQEIEAMLQDHAEIDKTQNLMVRLDSFGESSVNFVIYAFTSRTDTVPFQTVLQDILLKAYAIIVAHGAQCPYPSRTVYVNREQQNNNIGETL